MTNKTQPRDRLGEGLYAVPDVSGGGESADALVGDIMADARAQHPRAPDVPAPSDRLLEILESMRLRPATHGFRNKELAVYAVHYTCHGAGMNIGNSLFVRFLSEGQAQDLEKSAEPATGAWVSEMIDFALDEIARSVMKS